MVVTIESKVTIDGKFYATGPRSQIKNYKIAQTQWEYFFNDETFLMKGLALLLKVLWFFPMFTV